MRRVYRLGGGSVKYLPESWVEGSGGVREGGQGSGEQQGSEGEKTGWTGQGRADKLTAGFSEQAEE